MGWTPSHRSSAWMASLLAAIGWIRVTHAEPPVSFVLDYRTAPGIECPDRASVEQVVVREVGRPIFDTAAEQHAILAIAPADNELVARIAFTSPGSGEPAYRTVPAPLQGCRDLVRIFALLVALRAQGVEPEPEPEPERAPREARPRRPRTEGPSPPEAPSPPVEGSVPVPPVKVEPAVVVASPEEETVSHRWPVYALALGPGLRSGFAPQLNPTLRFGLSAELQPSVRVQVEVEGASGGEHAVSPRGAYAISGGTAIASACWSPLPGSRVTPWLCPVVSGTLVQVRGSGLDVSQTDRTFGLTGGFDARFRMALSRRFFVEAVVGGALNPQPHAVRVGGANVWESRSFWFNSALVFGCQLGSTPPRGPKAADLSTTRVPSKQ